MGFIFHDVILLYSKLKQLNQLPVKECIYAPPNGTESELVNYIDRTVLRYKYSSMFSFHCRVVLMVYSIP